MYGVLFFFVLFVIIIMQQDDPLSPESERWIDAVYVSATDQQRDAYYYLMGISAGLNGNPREFGRQRVLHYQEQVLASGNSYTELEYEQLSLPDSRYLCDRVEQGCLKTLVQGAQEANSVLEDNATLYERYLTFLDFDEYKTLLEARIEEPYPEFRYLMQGNKLLHINAVNLCKEQNCDKAISLIKDDIVSLRKHMILGDNLVYTLVMLQTIHQDLEVLSLLYHLNNSEISQFSELTPIEINLEKEISREFVMIAMMFKELDKNPEMLEVGGSLPGLYGRMLFKPNMSINQSQEFYQSFIDENKLSPVGFAKNIDINKQDESLEDIYLSMIKNYRNIVGEVLMGVGKPSLSEYTARLHDLNAKFRLVNLITTLPKGTEVTPELLDNLEGEYVNPYYPGKGPVIKERKLCYEGPLEDKKGIRCVTIH